MMQSVSSQAAGRSEPAAGGRSLFTLSGAAAAVFLVYSLVTIIILLAVGGAPATAQEGFDMLAQNRLAGLLRLDVLTILLLPLDYLLMLGLYTALKPANQAMALLALLLGAAGVTLVLATPSAFAFLTLSDRFAVAAQEQRTLLLAAGEAVLAADLWHGSGALMGGVLLQTGLLLLSLLMLRSPLFRPVTAWVGVATHGLDLLHALVILWWPAGGAALMFVAGPLYLLWYPLLARDFFRLARRR